MANDQRKAAKRKAERASKKAADGAVYARAVAAHKDARAAGPPRFNFPVTVRIEGFSRGVSERNA